MGEGDAVANFTPDKVIQVQDEAAARAELARVEARARDRGYLAVPVGGDGWVGLLTWVTTWVRGDDDRLRVDPDAVVFWTWGV